MPIYAGDPNIELNGDTTYAFLSSIAHSNFAHILERHGFAEIDRDAWYPLQSVLDVLKDIAHADDAMMNLVSIGMAAVENIELPPEVVSLTPDRFLQLYDQLYPTRHRNGSPGTVRAEVRGPNHACLILDADVPYPDDTMYGVVYGYMRCLQTIESFTVTYDEDLPRREEGGSETIIHVTW